MDSAAAFYLNPRSGDMGISPPKEAERAWICLSPDGLLYHVIREGNVSRYWLSVETTTDKKSNKAKRLMDQRTRFAGWLHATTKRGRSYRRAVYALEIQEINSCERKPISPLSHKFKDYALFHKWPI